MPIDYDVHPTHSCGHTYKNAYRPIDTVCLPTVFGTAGETTAVGHLPEGGALLWSLDEECAAECEARARHVRPLEGGEWRLAVLDDLGEHERRWLACVVPMALDVLSAKECVQACSVRCVHYRDVSMLLRRCDGWCGKGISGNGLSGKGLVGECRSREREDGP